MAEWATAIINGSLKETLIRPIRKKPSLVVHTIGNYRPVTNVSDETNALDPFQLSFRLRHGMEMALVTLFDDLLREADRVKMSFLVLLL